MVLRLLYTIYLHTYILIYLYTIYTTYIYHIPIGAPTSTSIAPSIPTKFQAYGYETGYDGKLELQVRWIKQILIYLYTYTPTNTYTYTYTTTTATNTNTYTNITTNTNTNTYTNTYIYTYTTGAPVPCILWGPPGRRGALRVRPKH
jgi:hypothetical protein